MTHSKPFAWFHCFVLSMALVGCCRSASVWENTTTASRYFGKGVDALIGWNDSGSQSCCRDEFYTICDDGDDPYAQFIPLQDDVAPNGMSMKSVDFPQPREVPGDPGCRLPSFEAFIDPSLDPELSKVFRNVHFAFDSSQVKGEENIARMRTAANYLKAHPELYVFIEGHCDRRGAEAYNLALGARRANIVRNMLIQEGVDKDHIFTISFGKEHLLVLEDHEEAHAKNRRAEFKVYRP